MSSWVKWVNSDPPAAILHLEVPCWELEVLADYFCYVKIGRFLSWLKDIANENLSGMVLVLFVNLEIDTRFLLVVGIGLLPVLLVLPLRRPFNIWCKEGAGNFGLDK